jgi:hypothetical protein
MRKPADTKKPSTVEREVSSLYLSLFPNGDHFFVAKTFGWMIEAFQGNYRDYQPIDALYHDLEHTLQGTLCLARLLHRRQLAKAQPPVTKRMFELGLLAILLHDSGYLKKRGDSDGTGAKYTLTHVHRSIVFAQELLREKGFSDEDVLAVEHMIRCTGVNTDLSAIEFSDDLERLVGFAVGTADLLGQMAAEDYVAKLPILYLEFAECGRYEPNAKSRVGDFSSAEDLLQKTPAFWEKYVLPRVEKDFVGLYRYLNDPYPSGPNFYVNRIESNIQRIRHLLAAKAAA